jgi:hypothetical protein
MGRECRQRSFPVVGNGIDLAVAIELITEQVVQHDHAGLRLADNLRQCGFVAFEQRCVVRQRTAPTHAVDDRGGHAGHQIRAGTIMQQTPPRCLEQ